MSLLCLAAGIPVIFYLLLCMGSVRESLRQTAQEQLSALLGAQVTVGKLNVEPFTRVILLDANVLPTPGDTLLHVDELNAAVSLPSLILDRRLVITDVELMQPRVALWRDSVGAPLNAQPVIDALRGDGQQKKPIRLGLNTLVLRGGSVSYDVRQGGQHLAVNALNADINAPLISPDSTRVSIRRLQFREESGITLSRLRSDIEYAANTLKINGLAVEMPQSQLRFDNMTLALKEHRIGLIGLRQGSAIAPADFASRLPIDPALLSDKIELSGLAELFADSLSVESLDLRAGNLLRVSAKGNKSALDVPQLELNASMPFLAQLAGHYAKIPPQVRQFGNVKLNASASWSKTGASKLKGALQSGLGPLLVDATMARGELRGSASTTGFNLGALLPEKQFGKVALNTDFNLSRTSGKAKVKAPLIEYAGHSIENIDLTANYRGKEYAVALTVDDDEIALSGSGNASLRPGDMAAELTMQVERLALPEAKYGFAGRIDARFCGPDFYNPTGTLLVSNPRITQLSTGKVAVEEDILLTSDFRSPQQSIMLKSGIADADIHGRIDPATLGSALKTLAATAFPQLFEYESVAASPNDFQVAAKVHERSSLLAMLPLPVRPLYDVNLRGRLGAEPDSTYLTLTAPYVQQGHKLLRDLDLTVHGGPEADLRASVRMDNKKGPMRLELTSDVRRGTAATRLNWQIDNPHRYVGDIGLDARPLPSGVDVNIHQSHMALNDTIWTISPAYVGARGKSIVVHNLNVDGPGQHALVSGVVSPDSADVLTVDLQNISLDYIFDTLALNAVHFSGHATGTVTGRQLLSGAPQLQTDALFVRDFGYNHCTFGDAQIRAEFDPETAGIIIGADIDNKERTRARVDGMINPVTQALDFNFQAEELPVAFLQPFLATWADRVDGRASGWAHLFGDFINVDVEGDLKAEDFALQIGFTGVTYHAADSVHIRPGLIELNNIRVTDDLGHSAMLNGRLTHDHFFESDFEFNVTDAKSLLVYDLGPQPETIFYGHVLGSGGVGIRGRTGSVSIDADMQTAPGSTFSVMVTDATQAADYNFLTFNDPTRINKIDVLADSLQTRIMDERKKELMRRRALGGEQSAFDLNFRIDVTPEAEIILVMDPIAGDKITAHGAGHIDFMYDSGSDDMRMYGDYLIDRGHYNFTLQDIIRKEFTIRPGSVVAFHGDPMDAALNVKAQYEVNANLTDLDESFATDKELARTNVLVQAVLQLGGDLQNPDISFDLDFPRLTSDVKRKVRSIVSTDDMMNRQIIYLLALNRFYTPDYMEGATKGNGLASLASGTLSSQLSNILGQISDKFSVAPSVRSDAGDFSDVEFDVALSSTLLNNRLLLNGNLGYRDKSLNNNQFIGDFDLEYLLNRSGAWRVKAYNHFNDRNFYIKTALTTQGLGIVFKHDFD